MCPLLLRLSLAMKMEHRWDRSTVHSSTFWRASNAPTQAHLLFSSAAILCLSASCMTGHCSNTPPVPCLCLPPGELYSRDSENSCNAKIWCHRLTAPQCFQRHGCKLGPLDRPPAPPPLTEAPPSGSPSARDSSTCSLVRRQQQWTFRDGVFAKARLLSTLCPRMQHNSPDKYS